MYYSLERQYLLSFQSFTFLNLTILGKLIGYDLIYYSALDCIANRIFLMDEKDDIISKKVR